MALARIYDCKKCGKTVRVGIHEEIADNDKTYEIPYCLDCLSEVKPTENYRMLTDEEIKEETGFYDNMD